MPKIKETEINNTLNLLLSDVVEATLEVMCKGIPMLMQRNGSTYIPSKELQPDQAVLEHLANQGKVHRSYSGLLRAVYWELTDIYNPKIGQVQLIGNGTNGHEEWYGGHDVQQKLQDLRANHPWANSFWLMRNPDRTVTRSDMDALTGKIWEKYATMLKARYVGAKDMPSYQEIVDTSL